MYASSPGVHSLYIDEDFLDAQNAANIVDEMGVGQFDALGLNRKLTGKTLSLSPYIGELYEGFYGNTSVEDAETFFKLIYLYATAPREDSEDFERMMDQTKEQLRNLSANPMVAFRSEIARVKYNDNIRRKAIPTEEDMNTIDLKRAMEIYKDRFDDFSDFTFVLVGSFKPEALKPHIEQYLGALPSINRKEKGKDINIEYATDGGNSNIKKGLAPQANVYISFTKPTEVNLKKALEVEAMGKVLNIMVRENLREEKGGVYSPFVRAGTEREPKGMTDVVIFFQCAPEDVEELVAAVKEEIEDLQKNGPTQENYDKVRETLRRGRESDLEKNRFWVNTLATYYRQGRDLGEIKGFDAALEGLTKADIKKASETYADWENAIIVTVKPEKETNDKP